MKEELISVIIPIYKAEKFLDKCLDSIVNQEYKNLEIILIDDGSPDNCPKMCDDWAKKDKRVKVVHKQNGGVCSARNEGLKMATGKYATFIDSDDYITADFSKFVKTCLEKDCDISYSFLKNFSKKQNEKIMKNLTSEDIIYYAKNNIAFCCGGKLIKLNLIKNNNLYFRNGLVGEDLEWTMRSHSFAKSIFISDISFYQYEITNTSASRNMSFNHLKSGVENMARSFEVIDGFSYSKKAKNITKSYIVNNLYYFVGINGRFDGDFEQKLNVFKTNKNIFVRPSMFKFRLIYYFVKLVGLKFAMKIFQKLIK